jgi:galactokinase
MDQFAVVKGKKDHLILLNCETLDYELIKADFEPYVVVLLNSNVSHSLASSEYNVRRDECDTALVAIKKKHPNYHFLTEIPIKVVEEFKNVLPVKIYKRALYVIQENKRTLKAANCLKKKDLKGFGECLYRSHHGLQHLYEVSCKELDFLVAQTKALDFVVGSRMMGGGFGGCTINIVHKDKVGEFIETVSAAYEEKHAIKLSSIITTISDGVKKIEYGVSN